MKREMGAQFGQHGCLSANMPGSGVGTSRVLGHCTAPCHQLAQSYGAQQPSLCQHMNPALARRGLGAPQNQLLPLQSLWLILSCSTSGTRRMQPCKARRYLPLPAKTSEWGKQTRHGGIFCFSRQTL